MARSRQPIGFLFPVAWRNLWRHRRRSLITASAMAVAVAMCMAALCITDGMYIEMFDLMVDQQLGHVQIHHTDYAESRSIYDSVPQETMATVDTVPGTETGTMRLKGYALLGGDEKSTGAQLVGIEPEREKTVTRWWKNMRDGAYLSQPGRGEIIVGIGLAKTLEIGVGDELVAVTQAADGSMGNALFVVKGVYKSGNVVQDKIGAYLHLSELQELLVMEGQVHEITLLTTGADAIESYAEAVKASVGSDTVLVQTWQQASPQTAEMFGMRDFSIALLLGIVFSVAAFGIFNTMMMSVFERTRELGVLKAIGLRPARMVGMVFVESLMLAGLAVAIGLVLGGGFDWYLVEYGIDMSAAVGDEGYEFMGVTLEPVMKGAVQLDGIILTAVSVFVVSGLASLYPGWMAARLQPVEAIRTE